MSVIVGGGGIVEFNGVFFCHGRVAVVVVSVVGSVPVGVGVVG